MRVLYVIEALGEGGTEMSLAEMLPGLQQAGVVPTIALLKSRGEEGVEQRLVQAGIDVRVLAPGRFVQQVRELRAIIRAVDPVLIHTMLYRANQLGRLAAMRTSVPVVTSLVNVTYSRERLADPELRVWRVRLAQLADAVMAHMLTTKFHAVSQSVKAHAVQALRLPPEQIVVVPRGRSTARLGHPSPERTCAARSALGLTPSDRVIVSVGRQEYQKGHRQLLAALPSVLRAFPNTVVLIAGRDGSMTAQLQRDVDALGLRDTVRFLGHVADVGQVLAAADIFVFPSHYEGLPGAVIEAMALGLPVVANDIPMTREVVDEHQNATLVDVSDSSAFAEAMIRMLGDDEIRGRFGRRSLQMFEARYTIERAVDGMLGLYRLVAPGHVPGPPSGRVHGVVVTYRRPAGLQDLLARVGSDPAIATLTVVDNAPSTISEEIMQGVRSATPIEYLAMPENLGPAGAIAAAMEAIVPSVDDADWIFLFDDDNPPEEPGAIADLLGFAERVRSVGLPVGAVGMVGSRFNRRTGRFKRPGDDELHGAVDVDYIAGGQLLMLSVGAIRSVGTFDPDLFFGFDDLEFCLRLRDHGYTILADGDAWLRARRRNGRTGNRVPRSSRDDAVWRRYYAVRNHIVVMRRHGRFGAALACTVGHCVRPMIDLARRRSHRSARARLTMKAIGDAWCGRLGRRVEPHVHANAADQRVNAGAQR